MSQENQSDLDSNELLKKIIKNFHCEDGFGPMFTLIISLVSAYFFILYVPPTSDSKIFGYITIIGVCIYLISVLIEKWKLLDLIQEYIQTESNVLYVSDDNSMKEEYDNLAKNYGSICDIMKELIKIYEEPSELDKSKIKNVVEGAKKMLPESNT